MVNCDGIGGFGCTADTTCISNRCVTSSFPTTACQPGSPAQVCAAASADCGNVPDGCGGTVSCDTVQGFGCDQSSTCNAQNKCQKKASSSPTNQSSSTNGTVLPGGGDTTEPPPPSTASSDGNSDKKKPAEEVANLDKKKKASGCSAAPGESNEGLSGALPFLAIGLLARRRRRSRDA
jgi:MYXO-CTERM domain-containing protein